MEVVNFEVVVDEVEENEVEVEVEARVEDDEVIRVEE